MFELSKTERMQQILRVTPGWQEIALAHDLDDDTVTAILDEAEKLATDVLSPVGQAGDAEGCRIVDGRVIVPDSYHDAFAALAAGGWQAMDLPDDMGGLSLPTALHSAATTFFEAEAMAFMMSASRPAAHLLFEWDKTVAATWLPKLAAGEWATTICISEPDAGSDVGRIRTRAVETDGVWRVTGTKCWISFGDHTMTDRIGHCMLARTGAAEDGTRGLSLFLVPSTLDDGRTNGVTVSRIEEKLGIHGSPTCVMAFDTSEAILLGVEGRGISQMFRMIELMRLQTACQGLGVAQRATEIATAYAAERRQGGKPTEPAVPIITHPDVQRQLVDMAARTEVLRAVVLQVSLLLDQARAGDAEASARAAFLLPLAKNFGGTTAFDVASAAIQVLGGAGFTREWPVEQLLRDARVITIYEGTTGMQAQDFFLRRILKDDGRVVTSYLDGARADILAVTGSDPAKDAALAIIGRFQALCDEALRTDRPAAANALAAKGYLDAGWVALSAHMAARLMNCGGQLAELGTYRLGQLSAEMAVAEQACRLRPDDLPAIA